MIKKKSICLIPARSGSKGLKNKNILDLKGKPLLAWPIQAALNSRCFDKVVVSTDSEKIKLLAQNHGAECPFLRPKKLAQDNSKSLDVVLHALKFFERKKSFFDYLCLLEPTSPLTTAEDIKSAFRMLTKSKVATSLVGVGEVSSQNPTFQVNLSKTGLISHLLNIKDFHVRRQDITKNYYLDGSIYFSRVDSLKRNKSFYQKKTIGKVFPKHKNIEVDDKIDLLLIESILENKSFLKAK